MIFYQKIESCCGQEAKRENGKLTKHNKSRHPVYSGRRIHQILSACFKISLQSFKATFQAMGGGNFWNIRPSMGRVGQ